MKSILLPVDLVHASGWEKATAHAVDLARQTGAHLHAMTVIPDYGMAMVGGFFPAGYSEKAMEETRNSLENFLKENIGPDVSSSAHVRHGTVYKEIISAAEALKADMVIMESHRPEMRDYLLGPNAARVTRHAPCSVCVMR